jgi:hypothetical protein
MATGAQAETIANDPFLTGGSHYTIGNINGQNPTVTGFTDPWFPADGGGSYSVSSTPLSYSAPTGYAKTPGAGALVNTVDGERADRLLDPGVTSAFGVTSGTVYMSFELQLANVGGYEAVELWSPSGGQAEGNRVLQLGYSTFGDFPSSSKFGIRVNDDSSGSTTGSFDPVDNSTHLFVLQFNLNSGASADTLNAWEDPTDLTGAAPTGGTKVSLSGFSVNDIGTFDLAEFGGNTGTALSEVRIGSTLADISGIEAVPEPSTNYLILLGLGALFPLRRKLTA